MPASKEPVPLVRIEGDTNSIVYVMGKEELVIAANHGKDAKLKQDALVELARRAWNTYVKKMKRQ